MTLKPLIIFTLLSAALLAACAPKQEVPSKADALEWSETTLNIVTAGYPSSLDTLIRDAVIPKTFKFNQTPKSLGEAENYTYFPDDQNAQFLRNVGIVSSLADHCKLDFDNLNFLPMMSWQREYLSRSEHSGYKIYVIGVSHGYAMGSTDKWLQDNPIDCTRFKDNFKGRSFKESF